MKISGSRLALLILILVVLTVLIAISSASLAIWLAADWEKHRWALMLTLKIMWGTWAVLVTSTFLTWVTMVGWRFRRASEKQAPTALLKSIAAGELPPSWAKTSWTSFTVTVVHVSLSGIAFLASVLLWILGDWNQFAEPLTLALKWIWGTWWVLVIATVLTRIAIFARQKRKLEQGRMKGNGEDGKPK